MVITGLAVRRQEVMGQILQTGMKRNLDGGRTRGERSCGS